MDLIRNNWARLASNANKKPVDLGGFTTCYCITTITLCTAINYYGSMSIHLKMFPEDSIIKLPAPTHGQLGDNEAICRWFVV